MKGLPSAERIIKEIEFEILLGTISQENFGDSIQAIRIHQSNLRAKLLETLRDSRLREAFAKVFQFQEMLLVLLQEMGIAIQSLRASLPEIINRVEATEGIGTRYVGSPLSGDDEELLQQSHINAGEIAKAIEPSSLRLNLEIRPTKLAGIGRLIRSVKIAFHQLVLFYVNRLGAQQARINRVYGEQILELLNMVLYQQEQLNAMAALINDLRSQIKTEGEV